MWPRFGIKMGNSTLSIALIKSPDTKPHIITNKEGNRTTPATVFWNGHEEIECGLTAQLKMIVKPNQGINNSFQLINYKNSEEIIEDTNGTIKHEKLAINLPNNYDNDKENFQLNCQQGEELLKKNMDVKEIQVKLLLSQLELAREFCHSKIENPIAVLSVPSYYSTDARIFLVDAANKAGFQVSQVIDESVAAILAYGIGENDSLNELSSESKSEFILTIKCGGLFSSFDVYEVRDGFYFKLDGFGPYRIGGQQITESLVQYVCDEFKKKYKLDPYESRRAIAKIRTAVNNCKHILSTLPATQLYVESLMDGVDFNVQMTRARLECIIQPLLANFMQILNDVVKKTFYNHPNMKTIDGIILFGATIQTPKLQNIIKERFPYSKLYTDISGSEVVAMGCAHQTLFLTNFQDDILQNFEECEIADESVVIWHGNKSQESNAEKILNKGDLLPKTVSLDLKCAISPEERKLFHLRSGSRSSQSICFESTTELNNDNSDNDTDTETETLPNTVRVEVTVNKTPVDGDSPMISLKCL